MNVILPYFQKPGDPALTGEKVVRLPGALIGSSGVNTPENSKTEKCSQYLKWIRRVDSTMDAHSCGKTSYWKLVQLKHRGEVKCEKIGQSVSGM